jgi:iron(III) transport system permease protein
MSTVRPRPAPLVFDALPMPRLRLILSGLGRNSAAFGVASVLIVLVGAPIAMVLIGSFRGPSDFLPFESGTVWTLDNYKTLVEGGVFRDTLRDTAIYAGGSLVLALGFGISIAWLVGRTNLPGRRIVYVLMLAPLMTPSVINAMSWLLLLNPERGYLNVALRAVFDLESPGPFDPFSLAGMIVVQGMALASFAYLLTISALANFDPGLEEASRTSGAGFWRTLRRVTLPVLRPALFAAVIVCGIFAVEGIEVPLLLGTSAGIRVISLELYTLLNPSSGLPLWGNVLALAMVFLLFAYALFAVYQRLTARAQRFATVSGKGFRPRRLDLGGWRWVALVPVAAYLLLQVVFPLVVLVWTSLHESYPPFTWEGLTTLSFVSYGKLFDDPVLVPAVVNTAIVSAASATLVTVVAAIAAWVVVRSTSPLRQGIDLLASSSLAIPGVLAGIAFLVFYLTVPNPVYGTIWLLILVFSYRTAFAYRLSSATMVQISRELEEASLVSGASRVRTFRRVVVPLLAPGLVLAWLLVFLVGTREFTLPMLLGQRAMLGPMLYYSMSSIGKATALATLSLAVIAALAAFAMRFSLRVTR